MEKEPLISIIIPIYNVEKYLRRCIDSVINQTYKNIEILLVDDGSPDSSGEICEQYKKNDDRVYVFHKKNGGLSDARNYGIKYAKGKYITFIDSDDYIAKNYIEYLYTMIVKYHAEISVCCMIQTNSDVTDFTNTLSFPAEQVFSGKEACFQLLNQLYMTLVTACGKLYSTEIVRKYPFPKGKKHEDEATTCKYYYDSNKVVVGNRCLYAYYQNSNSITHSKGNELNHDVIWALNHRAEFFKMNNEALLEKYAWGKLMELLINDSLNYNNRCDKMLRSFKNGKELTIRKKIELAIYNSSHLLYKVYIKLLHSAAIVKSKMKKIIRV